jgi:translation initiation factor 4A
MEENKEKDNKNYQTVDYEDFDEPLCKYHGGSLLKGVYEYGFEKPSPIQAKSIDPIADGHDLIAQAQSGSGKTGAFVIGALMKVDPTVYFPQAVILANTRELASQIRDVTHEIGKFIGGGKHKIKVTLCIGGIHENLNRTELNLKDAMNSHILVCTPGRLNGLLKESKILLDNLKILIFDEADQLLSNDFIDQIKSILQATPQNTQICLFSATTNSRNIQNTKKHFMSNPVELHIKKEDIKVDQIKNYVIDAEKEENKYPILLDLYKSINICQAVIFVNTISNAAYLTSRLRKDGHTVGLIHGKLSDVERMETLKKFRKAQTRILVATDVIARGIDVQQVGLVINYDIPTGNNYQEQYIHRIGRSGRYGKLGVAINILTNDKAEWFRVKDISTNYHVDFSKMPSLDQVNYYLSGVKGYSFTESKN